MAGAMCRAAAGARLRSDHLRARPERAGVHLPAAGRVHHQRPRRLHRRRLAGPGVRPGRPLPVQRQEVRRRPGGDDRGDPAPDPRSGRLSATATSISTRRRWSTCRSRPSTSSSAPTSSARRRCRRSSARSSRPSRRSASAARSARWASRTRPRRSCAPISTATGPSSTRRPVSPGPVQGQRPDRHFARRRAAAGRRRGRGGARLRHARATVGRRPRVRPRRRRPTRRIDAARRAVPPLSARRDGRDPPRDGLPEPALRAPGVPAELLAEIEGWCAANTADERKDGESDTQFLYKTRKKALGPYKRRLWELPGKDEIIASQESKLRFLFEQLAIAGTREMVERYIRPARRSMPAPMPSRSGGAYAGGLAAHRSLSGQAPPGKLAAIGSPPVDSSSNHLSLFLEVLPAWHPRVPRSLPASSAWSSRS